MGRGLLNATVGAALALSLAVAGCGGSSSTSSSTQAANASRTSTAPPAATTAATPPTGTSATTPATTGTQASKSRAKEPAAAPALVVSSPVLKADLPIPTRYTCRGANESPPLNWRRIPKGTAEIVLFIAAVGEEESNGEPPIYWAVAGLPPASKGLAAGKLPPGAVVGRNSTGKSGYSVCPRQSNGGVQHYLVAVYALKHTVSAKPGFDATALLQGMSRSVVASEGLTAFTG
jgi:phosphatidylethanolamine-binding protein (PEBP) family uncharacterized protein